MPLENWIKISYMKNLESASFYIFIGYCIQMINKYNSLPPPLKTIFYRPADMEGGDGIEAGGGVETGGGMNPVPESPWRFMGLGQ